MPCLTQSKPFWGIHPMEANAFLEYSQFMTSPIAFAPPDSLPAKHILFDNLVSRPGSRFHAVKMIRHVSLLALGKLRGTDRMVE